jgi:coenzyme F420-reducing hydrogenase gamma subunit
MTYCQYGKKDLDTPTDCNNVPSVISCTGTGSAEAVCQKYCPKLLSNCVGAPGTKHKSVLTVAGMASVASTVIVREGLGTALERWVRSTFRALS